ncbi:hypothetical protein [Hymenobacter terricola]|uniref:hypothetical protein n=1 Tax=Hymenobacter terricola TaxID=2819236 RepID=UPI001B304356|nr:hypothetical protein [Hymenobacter terricola]
MKNRFPNLMLRKISLLSAGVAIALAGCQKHTEEPAQQASTADFSRYIAVGSSFTAGYADGGLCREGQMYTYPNILSEQFRGANGSDFNQPFFNIDYANGSGYLHLTGYTTATATAPIMPVLVPVTTSSGIRTATPQVLYAKYVEPINNLGVPGLRMADIETVGYGGLLGNPYFERITPTATPNQTYLQRVRATVTAIKPTFFTEWMGTSDVFDFAMAGGASATAPLTRTDTFTLKTTRLLDALMAGGAKGLISTIPEVTSLPYFTAVGPSFKAILTARSISSLVVMTGAVAGGATSGNRKVITTADIRDASGGRQLLTLPSAAFLGYLNQATDAPWRYVYAQSGQPAAGFAAFLTANGVDTTRPFGTDALNPIPSAFVLDDVEQAQVAAATTAFNLVLVNAATARKLALFDANAFFRTVASGGFATSAATSTGTYLAGNIFSLDGVYLTPRGYATLANEIFTAVSTKYGGNFRTVDVSTYRGSPR